MKPRPRSAREWLTKLAIIFVTGLSLSTGVWAYAQETHRAPAASNVCAADSGGITLSPGFCATFFADKLGHARHLGVAPNGVVYVNTWSGRYYHFDTPPPGGFLVPLQDTKGDGRADRVVRFGPTKAEGNAGGTGIAIYEGYLCAETNDRIVRYRLPTGGIEPTGATETIVSGLPLTGDHQCHGTDGKGTAMGSDLTSGKWLWGNASLQAISRTIAQGVPKPKQREGVMPPMGGTQLSQADLAAVADYVWALGHSNTY